MTEQVLSVTTLTKLRLHLNYLFLMKVQKGLQYYNIIYEHFTEAGMGTATIWSKTHNFLLTPTTFLALPTSAKAIQHQSTPEQLTLWLNSLLLISWATRATQVHYACMNCTGNALSQRVDSSNIRFYVYFPNLNGITPLLEMESHTQNRRLHQSRTVTEQFCLSSSQFPHLSFSDPGTVPVLVDPGTEAMGVPTVRRFWITEDKNCWLALSYRSKQIW